MAYSETDARQKVIEAGLRLLETGLIARTWGNVSARISDTQFVITPSGRPYDVLTPDDLVTVNISDCSYTGDVKPSSEKGIHADAYRLREDVDFVIHTHQVRASVVGATGLNVDVIPDEFKGLFGECVPVAGYGMPSTDKLRKAVEKCYTDYPESKVFLMTHHGAVCLGKDFDEAFELADNLEKLCKIRIHKAFRLYEGSKDYSRKAMLNSFLKANRAGSLPKYISDLGESELKDDGFIIKYKNGKSFFAEMNGKSTTGEEIPSSALIHAAIYRDKAVKCIRPVILNEVIGYSVTGRSIRPMLDDFAQIAGAKIGCAVWDGSAASAKSIAKTLSGKNVVLVKGHGALVTGKNVSDAEAVEMVLSKECQTQIGSLFFGAGTPLSPVDCNLMRYIYLTKYSKKAGE